MDDNPYRSPRSDGQEIGPAPDAPPKRLLASVRPAFLLAGGVASALYGVTLLTTIPPATASLGAMIAALLIGTAATLGGAALMLYSSRLR